MFYAIAFFLFALAMAHESVSRGGWWLLLLWPATSFMVVSAAYAALGPKVMGKRSDGRLAQWSFLPLLPFRMFVYASWWFGKTISREPVHAEVAPGVWIGRRAQATELPPGTALVIDLTSELREPESVRTAQDYFCVPTLDASIPYECGIRSALEQIAASRGSVYIHCAQGHGRSATLAAIVLIKRGLAADVDDAVRQLTSRRPGVRLNRRQRDFVTAMTQPQ